MTNWLGRSWWSRDPGQICRVRTRGAEWHKETHLQQKLRWVARECFYIVFKNLFLSAWMRRPKILPIIRREDLIIPRRYSCCCSFLPSLLFIRYFACSLFVTSSISLKTWQFLEMSNSLCCCGILFSISDMSARTWGGSRTLLGADMSERMWAGHVGRPLTATRERYASHAQSDW